MGSVRTTGNDMCVTPTPPDAGEASANHEGSGFRARPASWQWVETGTWFALFAPRGTATDVVEQLNAYVRALADDPESRKRIDAAFLEPMTLTAAQFADQVKADAAKRERIARASGV